MLDAVVLTSTILWHLWYVSNIINRNCDINVMPLNISFVELIALHNCADCRLHTTGDYFGTLEWSNKCSMLSVFLMLNYDMFDWQHVNDFIWQMTLRSNPSRNIYRVCSVIKFCNIQGNNNFGLNPKSKYLHCPLVQLPNFDIDIFEVNDAQVPASSNSNMCNFLVNKSILWISSE